MISLRNRRLIEIFCGLVWFLYAPRNLLYISICNPGDRIQYTGESIMELYSIFNVLQASNIAVTLSEFFIHMIL